MGNFDPQWDELIGLMNRHSGDPIKAAKEFLRGNGWIVERTETLSLPVKVARTGSFCAKGGFRVSLHTRVNVGGRMMQIEFSIDASQSYLPAHAFAGSVSQKISRAIVEEIRPAIESGFERELARAKEEI